MVSSVRCPKCQKRMRSPNHLCQPTAIARLAPLLQRQRRGPQG